ncbi:uncharacterized protein LOC125656951 [Ostrea edulis]|uniref:uncharacterized protein LOC125656951 n=1 Tax=Ostrea edulis TaxID=37623 RepID=UPI002095566B|nr:uncharacterized protein LOC125656951 [Ostrea edulis]
MTNRRSIVQWTAEVLLLFFVPVVTLNKTIVKLDTTGERDCGGIYNISSEDEVRLMAGGRLLGGTCAVTLRFDNHDTLECEKVCIKMSVSQLQTCDMTMSFVPVTFDKTKVTGPKRYDCRNPFPEVWCPFADVVYVLVTESNRYPKNTKTFYKFNVDLTPQCVKKTDRMNERETQISYKYTVEKSSREKWIYVEGVVVSICLASIFFVALVVFICYYRAQKKTSPQRCEVPKSSSKEPILVNVRSKLPFRSHKKKGHDLARSSESYHQISDSDQNVKPDVEVSDIMQNRTDSASTLVIGQDNKRVAENQV